MSFTDSQYKVSRPDGYGIHTEHGAAYGSVRTRYGFVKVYSEGSRSSLEFIAAGVCYHRWFGRALSARGLVTKANSFVEEIYWRQS